MLSLGSTSVSGDVSGLVPLTQLTVLNLGSTSVSGDVSGLAPLTQLQGLYLSGTSVCGQRDGRDYGTCLDVAPNSNCCTRYSSVFTSVSGD